MAIDSDDEFLLYLLFLDSDSSEENEFIYSEKWREKIEVMSELQFRETFRMTKICFETLFSYILNNYTPKNLTEIDLLLFLFYIGHISTFRKMREIFGLPKSTIHRKIDLILNLFISIAKKEIKMPNVEELPLLERGFLEKGEFQGCILAIDGTHIEITSPASDFDFYNRKGHFSINFVCAVDYKKRFRGASYGFGSSHDARIYRRSTSLRDKIESYPQRYFCVADSAFSGFNNVLATISTTSNYISNEDLYELGKQRVVVENAFGLLKNKFKRLKYPVNNANLKKIVKIFYSALWLHNFIIDFEEE